MNLICQKSFKIAILVFTKMTNEKILTDDFLSYLELIYITEY